jgi:hypothetical protein
MFRPLPGFKAKYHQFTLLVAADFDEWRVVLLGPAVTIVGSRQFNEARAKDHARTIAESFLKEKGQDLPVLTELEWIPFESGEWLNWR